MTTRFMNDKQQSTSLTYPTVKCTDIKHCLVGNYVDFQPFRILKEIHVDMCYERSYCQFKIFM